MISKKYGFIKPALDAHTLGLTSISEYLRDCGFEVVIGDYQLSEALNEYQNEIKRQLIVDWILEHQFDGIGISYRLDHDDALDMVGYLIETLKDKQAWFYQGGPVEQLYFGGLYPTCQVLSERYEGLVTTFSGGESIKESLLKLQVPLERIPKDIISHSRYDDLLFEFGKTHIEKDDYQYFPKSELLSYLQYGKKDDHLMKRLKAHYKTNQLPLTRAHMGPYRANISRKEALDEFYQGVSQLAMSGHLDILSIGTSQLSQSAFEEDWQGKLNGGGVPINSIAEYEKVYEQSRPTLVRTYAGTKNIPYLAQVYESSLNIAWHALSLWWFNELDERGPYDLLTNLTQHIETIKYIASTNKPFEVNVSHHFSFRGGDDLTYIVSAYLGAKLAKLSGVKVFVLQNMLNTPRLSSGINDIAKARALLKLIKSLEDKNFKVIYQPRAGLDYFKPVEQTAKIQLAAISALMDDVDPYNLYNPDIIHVVSYSEALHLANPQIINESIQITKSSMQAYRKLKTKDAYIKEFEAEISLIYDTLVNDSMRLIKVIEHWIPRPYTALGLYQVFASGFLIAPYLWKKQDEFKHTINWQTKVINGQVKVIDNNQVMSLDQRLKIIRANLMDLKVL